MIKAHDLRPMVSVIIPVYNAARYLEQTVQSVLKQSFANYEILLVDDGSTDGSKELLFRLQEADDRIRVLVNEENLGVALTRNRAIEESRGTFLAFLDADDLWLPEKLEKQLALAARTGADLLYSSYSFVDQDGQPCGRSFLARPCVDFDSMLLRNEIGCSTAMVRRSALGAHRFLESFYHEDYVLWMELLKDGCIAAGVPEILADYRILPGSRSYRKLRSAHMRWTIYRKALRLPLWKSILSFVAYAVNGLMKYRL